MTFSMMPFSHEIRTLRIHNTSFLLAGRGIASATSSSIGGLSYVIRAQDNCYAFNMRPAQRLQRSHGSLPPFRPEYEIGSRGVAWTTFVFGGIGPLDVSHAPPAYPPLICSISAIGRRGLRSPRAPNVPGGAKLEEEEGEERQEGPRSKQKARPSGE